MTKKPDQHHHHSHSHAGSGHHHHSHASLSVVKNHNFAFALGISLNLLFVVAEAIYGILANSLALLADAGHNLSDVIGLAIAWIAFWLAKKKPTTQFTYGLRRSSILSALFNALILLLAIGAIIFEAGQRLGSPAPIQSFTVMVIAGLGIVINAATALLFMKDRHHDLNIRGAYLHMAMDALISFGVVLTGLVIFYTNWNWLDPVISILICLIVVVSTWGLLKDSFKLSMDAVPPNVDPEAVKKYFASFAEIKEVHDLHIWGLSTTENALTVHLVMPLNTEGDHFFAKVAQDLKEKYNIHHPTIQIETGDKGFHCELKPNDVV